MTELKHDWLTDGMIDFEYKKYVLLAYLKDIKSHFNSTELYPFLSDLIFHYKNLLLVRNNQQLLYEGFPKSITKADFHKLEFTYKRIVDDSELMKEIEDILAFAIPSLEKAIEEGKEIYEFVEDNLELHPVGLTPIYQKEGYVLVQKNLQREIDVFKYQLSLFETHNERYRAINTTFLERDLVGLSRSYEQIKLDLIKKFKDLPNPATFLVISKLDFPLPQTIMPVAKRMLVQYIED